MKQLCYIILLFIFAISCKHHTTKSLENSEVINDIDTRHKLKKSFTNKDMAQQKLQDYFDLLVLQNTHPEFKNTITKQLEDYAATKQHYITDTTPVFIKNVTYIKTPKLISDSVTQFHLKFDKVSKHNIVVDSIIAQITTKIIVIDYDSVKTNKIKFLPY